MLRALADNHTFQDGAQRPPRQLVRAGYSRSMVPHSCTNKHTGSPRISLLEPAVPGRECSGHDRSDHDHGYDAQGNQT